MDKSLSRPLLTLTSTASGAVNANRFIDYSGTETTTNEAAMGISLSSAQDGESFPVATHGIVGITLAATLAAGSLLSSSSDGKGKSQFGSEPKLARTLVAGTSGDIVPAILITS